MTFEESETELKKRIVEHVKMMKTLDPEYALWAHNFYKKLLGEYWK